MGEAGGKAAAAVAGESAEGWGTGGPGLWVALKATGTWSFPRQQGEGFNQENDLICLHLKNPSSAIVPAWHPPQQRLGTRWARVRPSQQCPCP